MTHEELVHVEVENQEQRRRIMDGLKSIESLAEKHRNACRRRDAFINRGGKATFVNIEIGKYEAQINRITDQLIRLGVPQSVIDESKRAQ